MQIYQVGGSVRDLLLGTQSQDVDWVVVGSSVAEMTSKGFRQVGLDFPVFLHPETGDEYALARTERKTAMGYGGFSVETQGVTLEDDLLRRDLTINAMALTAEGTVVDPYQGQADLKSKTLRHVSDAFSEDPLRVLRVLRFHARYGDDWNIADETWELSKLLVEKGELGALVPERIWKEVSRAMMEPRADLFLRGMLALGLQTLPSFSAYKNLTRQSLDKVFTAAQSGASLETRFTLAFADTGALIPHQTIPTSVQKLCLAWSDYKERLSLVTAPTVHPDVAHDLFVRLGAFKDGAMVARFADALDASGWDSAPFRHAAQRAQAVDTVALTSTMTPGPQVGHAIRQARIQAIGT